jgi:WG containing repeat
MYVNRRGKVVITGVPVFDNGPDEFHDGLVRFVKGRKYGFADRTGKTVIPPRYDGAMPFAGGRAKVCLACVDKCADRECEHHVFSGGNWFSLDKTGMIRK